jgi:Peptidyl-prolyl cis-trans isomerase (rotamase) - cyclophilin family
MATTTKICIKLTDGREIKLELFPEIAPVSVANFIKLIDERYFDGLCFHRCINNFMIQGGGFYPHQNGTGLTEKSGAKTIKGEFKSNGVKNDLHHELGVISMARTNVPDSASSQFFLCSADCAFLDGQYAAFGKTFDDESNRTIKDISAVKTHSWSYYDDIPDNPVVIKTIEFI